jgi:hypothetical protein
MFADRGPPWTDPETVRRVGPVHMGIEFAEAFAALCLRFRRDWSTGPERMNPNGGTIAMGHAFDATGAIPVGECVDELERRAGRYGVAAVSGAAGLRVAVLLERDFGMSTTRNQLGQYQTILRRKVTPRPVTSRDTRQSSCAQQGLGPMDNTFLDATAE